MRTITTTAIDPAAPCARRPYLTQVSAERAWARAKASDPEGSEGLIIEWCSVHYAWHLGHRPKPTRGRQP
jgi:hypothetical protein